MMKINYQELKEAGKEAGYLALRAALLVTTYRLFLGGYDQRTSNVFLDGLLNAIIPTEPSATSKLTGLALLTAQGPGMYNQFRKLGVHAARISEDGISTRLRSAADSLPEITDVTTVATRVINRFNK